MRRCENESVLLKGDGHSVVNICRMIVIPFCGAIIKSAERSWIELAESRGYILCLIHLKGSRVVTRILRQICSINPALFNATLVLCLTNLLPSLIAADAR